MLGSTIGIGASIVVAVVFSCAFLSYLVLRRKDLGSSSVPRNIRRRKVTPRIVYTSSSSGIFKGLTASADIMTSSNGLASKLLGALAKMGRIRLPHNLSPESKFKMRDLGKINPMEIHDLKEMAASLSPEPIHYIQRLVNSFPTTSRYVAQFSELFEAMCVRPQGMWAHRFLWFTRVDDETFNFELTCSEFEFGKDIHYSLNLDESMHCIA